MALICIGGEKPKSVEPTPKPPVQPTPKPTESTPKPHVEPTLKPPAEHTPKPSIELTLKPPMEPTPKPPIEFTLKPPMDPTISRECTAEIMLIYYLVVLGLTAHRVSTGEKGRES